MRVLDVSHLRVEFGTEDGRIFAVKDVSFTLGRGEILALVGESGCGKSTVAMSIPRLLGDSNVTIGGSVRLNGADLSSLNEKEMQAVRGKDISVVFQEPMTSLNPAYTIGNQIAEVIRQHQKLSRQAAKARAIELLELVGIPDAARRLGAFPHELSGGMRQRVMIAIAVACDPQVLIADEPTTALDVTIQAGILDIFRRLRDTLGTSIILITHDLGVVADIADRVAIMYAGRIVELCSAQDVFSLPSHPYTRGLLGALPARAVMQGGRRRLTDIPGFVPPPTTDPDECQFAPRCPRATAECIIRRPALELVAAEHEVACYHPGPGDTP
ncbi:ABC transporter ATP-binding protein [Glaciibacter superstes]|uniref:ABC transporter ATP-binding protein n=1 Tax=Glaciibacter superstes TaxID=501023 RepID=UPI0003B6C99B|nr:ABC transporter ATP-binding protein [Glaciibacter superstes]